MTKTIILLLSLLTFSILFSQNGNLPLSKDSDTLNYKNIRTKENIVFGLQEINKENLDSVFRLQTSNFLLEIRKTKNVISGNVYYFVKEMLEDNDSVGIFKKVFKLKKEQVYLLSNLIESSKIKKIPSDIYIPNWSYGIDGITYTIEYVENETLYFKKYWTPEIQENVESAKSIIHFISELNKIIESKKLIKKFNRKIPFERWSWNGFGTDKKRAKSYE